MVSLEVRDLEGDAGLSPYGRGGWRIRILGFLAFAVSGLFIRGTGAARPVQAALVPQPVLVEKFGYVT